MARGSPLHLRDTPPTIFTPGCLMRSRIRVLALPGTTCYSPIMAQGRLSWISVKGSAALYSGSARPLLVILLRPSRPMQSSIRRRWTFRSARIRSARPNASGSCSTLANSPPVPCNLAPYIGVKGGNGNIRSIVISTTDTAGLLIDTLYLDETQPVLTQTITSSPAGVSLTVDGAACTAPCSFQWTAGATHTNRVMGEDAEKFRFESMGVQRIGPANIDLLVQGAKRWTGRKILFSEIIPE
jgi:hypothetical protein